MPDAGGLLLAPGTTAYDPPRGSGSLAVSKPGWRLPIKPNLIQGACFLALCAYLLSSYANEFALRIFNGKAYISTVTVALLPVLLLLSGSALRGLQAPFGKWWLAFGAWLAICAPFSVWKSNTASLLANYYFRSFLLYFVICACVLTVRRLKALMYVLGAGNLLLVLVCFMYGATDEGRFSVPQSGFSFLANANELGLQLLLGVIVLIFVVFQKGKLTKMIALGIMLLSAVYMLKAGSRGVFVASIATVLAAAWLSRNKLKILAVAAPLCALTFLMLPAETRHRLTYIAIRDNMQVTNEVDASTIASQLQREQLLWDSLRLTAQNPLFGVGPGEFMVADSAGQEKKGQPGTWRETHNSYTQVSSEAGLPGFLFYVASLVVCFRMSYRLYRQTAQRPGLEDYAGVSFCMLVSLITYAVGTIFDHLAYTSYLPIMAGISTAAYFTAQGALKPAQQPQPEVRPAN